jgi:hypothetical protein
LELDFTAVVAIALRHLSSPQPHRSVIGPAHRIIRSERLRFPGSQTMLVK